MANEPLDLGPIEPYLDVGPAAWPEGAAFAWVVALVAEVERLRGEAV